MLRTSLATPRGPKIGATRRARVLWASLGVAPQSQPRQGMLVLRSTAIYPKELTRGMRGFFNSLLGEDEIDFGQLFEDTLVNRWLEPVEETAVTRAPKNDVRDSVLPRKGDKSTGDVFVFEGDNEATHFLCRFQSVGDMTLSRRVDTNGRFSRRPDVDSVPLRVQLGSEARRLP